MTDQGELMFSTLSWPKHFEDHQRQDRLEGTSQAMTDSEPRAHHFVPQCWLAGFTDNGTKTGSLWVTDLHNKKQWPSSPRKSGFRNNFYRIEDPAPDPVIFEKQFGLIESETAPLLKTLYEKPRLPAPEELATLEVFIAFQYIRVPAFRPWLLKTARTIHKNWILRELKSPKSWERALREMNVPPEAEGASYEQMLRFVREDSYSLSANNDWFLMRGFKAAMDAVLPSLEQRYWSAVISSHGSFIASDNPVVMDGPKGELAGFRSAEIVIFPINKHVLLCSLKPSGSLERTTYKYIAHFNTFLMMNAQFVYSPESDFVWLDEANHCQTEWESFSKENIVKSIPGRATPSSRK